MDEATLKRRFETAGQGHVFAGFDRLDAGTRAQFLATLETVDLDWVRARLDQYRKEKDAGPRRPELKPAPVIALPKTEAERADRAAARAIGEEALRTGRLAAFVVAGGQGSRLGFEGPKGCYPIGAVTGRPLFRFHAEQIRARAKRYGTVIPWYIMTSTANDADTRAFFESNQYFGFDRKDVFFFPQAMVPSIDFEGKLILAAPGELALNPDGHGGSLTALAKSGAVADMKRRGIDTISYFQIDNPLITICDPVFAGYHLRAGADMSSKILEKCAPDEKVGAIAYIDGQLGVVEYSDLDPVNMHARDASGRLVYWAGSIAIHMLAVDFVERVGGHARLPWHVAVKKIPFAGADGTVVKPEKANGVKFETFVFDALPLTRASITMEVAREDEFAPVKNPDGIDSVVSCRELLTARAARWLEAAGIRVPRGANGQPAQPIELSPLYALDEDDMRRKAPRAPDWQAPVVLE